MTSDEGAGAPPRTALDVLATVLDAVSVAREYGFDTVSAFSAALDRVSGLDRDALEAMTAMLAATIAVSMKPSNGDTLDQWSEIHTWILANREQTR